MEKGEDALYKRKKKRGGEGGRGGGRRKKKGKGREGKEREGERERALNGTHVISGMTCFVNTGDKKAGLPGCFVPGVEIALPFLPSAY